MNSRAAVRLLVSMLFGGLVGAVIAVVTNPPLGALCAIATVGLAVVGSGVIVLWPMSADSTKRNAAREDFDPVTEEILVVAFALAGLVTIVVMLALRDSDTRKAAAAVALLGVASSWAMLHLMYATRYAYLYYRDPVGGIEWNSTDYAPSYRDFLYFSFNLGMTYQVSDTGVGNPGIRAVVFRHCLMSYLFGTVILAATINLVEGIVTS